MKYNEIRNLIAKGKLSEAINELRNRIEESDKPNREEIFLQSFRLNDKIRDLRKGLVSQNDADVLKAQITQGILQLLREMEEYELESEEKKTNDKSPTTNYYVKGDMVGGDKYKAKKITINKK